VTKKEPGQEETKGFIAIAFLFLLCSNII